MGAAKAFVHVDGQPMIARVLQALRTECADTLIVTKTPEPYETLGARIVPDERPDQAPLVGVCAGLRATGTPWAFVAACDLPYLSSDAVRLVAELAQGFDAAVPRVNGRWHPLHAVYAAAVWPVLAGQLERGVIAMIDALGALRVRPVTARELRRVDPGLMTLRNVNTPADLRHLAAHGPLRRRVAPPSSESRGT
jgi:molybdopterin-guanine dinucleotide biosynthesis protein A